jgi:hypothetical protein
MFRDASRCRDPMKRPRILFWSLQNSNVGNIAVLGIKL